MYNDIIVMIIIIIIIMQKIADYINSRGKYLELLDAIMEPSNLLNIERKRLKREIHLSKWKVDVF